jgi:hypothetical protein
LRIGRLSFGIANGYSRWGYEKAACGCRLLDLGKLYFAFLDRTCKCGACKQYECMCPCELCDKKLTDCDCEKFK